MGFRTLIQTRVMWFDSRKAGTKQHEILVFRKSSKNPIKSYHIQLMQGKPFGISMNNDS